MKKTLALILMLFFVMFSWGQQTNRTMKAQEAANETQEQRLTRAQDKKSKNGKKDLSMQKKVKIAKQQDRKAERVKPPKKKKKNMPKPKM
jgi:uncharacterized protein HemX